MKIRHSFGFLDYLMSLCQVWRPFVSFSEMEKIIMNGEKVGRWKEIVLIRSWEKLRGNHE